MVNLLLKAIPPQAARIYSLLIKHEPMSAKDIGKRLSVFPNTVYRAVKSLINIGLVLEIHQYPTRYQARPTSEAQDSYSQIVKQSFQEILGAKNTVTKESNILKLNFLQSRKELLELANKDAKQTQSTMHFIASGIELPAETILLYKQAIDRGVKVRVIVQRMDEVDKKMFFNWRKMGIEVRYHPNIEARIFIFDQRIVYFTSFNEKKKQEAIGMRFEYPPYAKLMNELFEKRWQAAKDIGDI